MIERYKGIVLRSIRFNDAFNVVDIYTESKGMLSYLVPVTVRKNAKVKRLLFQPLSLLEFEADYRAKNSLQYIKEAKLYYSFASLPYEPVKTAIALFLSEFLLRALRTEEGDVPLYRYIKNSICWLDASECGYSNFHLVFLMHLSRFIGIFPNTQDYVEGDYFDMINGCFTARLPEHPAYLVPDESRHIALLMRMNYDNMHRFVLNRRERERCLAVINDFYRLHLPGFPQLKSLEVLQALFE